MSEVLNLLALGLGAAACELTYFKGAASRLDKEVAAGRISALEAYGGEGRKAKQESRLRGFLAGPVAEADEARRDVLDGHWAENQHRMADAARAGRVTPDNAHLARTYSGRVSSGPGATARAPSGANYVVASPGVGNQLLSATGQSTEQPGARSLGRQVLVHELGESDQIEAIRKGGPVRGYSGHYGELPTMYERLHGVGRPRAANTLARLRMLDGEDRGADRAYRRVGGTLDSPLIPGTRRHAAYQRELDRMGAQRGFGEKRTGLIKGVLSAADPASPPAHSPARHPTIPPSATDLAQVQNPQFVEGTPSRPNELQFTPESRAPLHATASERARYGLRPATTVAPPASPAPPAPAAAAPVAAPAKPGFMSRHERAWPWSRPQATAPVPAAAPAAAPLAAPRPAARPPALPKGPALPKAPSTLGGPGAGLKSRLGAAFRTARKLL